jgi:type I restriction enzyme S subunit
LVEAGDVLVSVVGSVDKCAVVPPTLAGANVARAVARLRPSADLSPELLEAWMLTPSYLRQVALATGSDTAQPTLNMGDLANFRLHLPESRAGMERLTAEIQERRAVADAALRAIDHQVALLHERRQALLTAAVTGKLQAPNTPVG